MQEQIALIMTHVRMAWSHRWLALVVASLVCIAGWAYVISLPSSYTVKAEVFFNTDSALQPVLRGLAFNTNTQERAIWAVRRTLLTRPNLESVARTTDLDLLAKTPQELDKIVTDLQNRIKVSLRRNRFFNIHYTHEDPAVALRVVEAVLNNFVERSLGESRKGNTKTRDFIEEQIKDYEARLIAAENRRKDFRHRNMERGLLPGQGGDYYQRKQQNLAQLEDAMLQLQEAKQRRDSIQAQLSGEQPIVGGKVEGPMSERIAALEGRLDELLMQYTQKHPDVVSTRRLIAVLEERNREYAEAISTELREGGSPAGVADNPVYQNLRLAFSNAEAQVAALEARVKEFRSRDEELSGKIDQILAVEQELREMDRDYNVQKSKFNAFLERRERLAIGKEAERESALEFEILEPPRMPARPTKPDRVTLSAGVLLMGLGAGVSIAWLLAMLRPAFFSRDDLVAVSDLPLWGAVSRILTPRERAQRRLGYILFAGSVTSLIGVFAVLEFLLLMQVDLSSKLQSLIS